MTDRWATEDAIDELRSALSRAREAAGYEMSAKCREAVERAIDAIETAIGVLLPDDA